MTESAQQALRRTMELYSKTTRFALACNASDKIIGDYSFYISVFYIQMMMNNHCIEEPIQSRCAVLRYSKLSDKQMLKRLLEICDEEGVSYADEGLEAIIFTAQGDMRQVPSLVFTCTYVSKYFLLPGHKQLAVYIPRFWSCQQQ